MNDSLIKLEPFNSVATFLRSFAPFRLDDEKQNRLQTDLPRYLLKIVLTNRAKAEVPQGYDLSVLS